VPAAKDPEQRVGHPSHAADDPRFTTVSRTSSKSKGLPIPEPNPNWLPPTRSWFNSLKVSGQSEFFEASDWATAVAAAIAFDRFQRTDNASIFQSFVRLSERLGATIVDRKRARIELVAPDVSDADEDAADQAVTGWHRRLRAVPD
jgi:hypothetical protein